MSEHALNSWDVLREAIGNKAKFVAELIGYGMNTVYKWMMPQPGPRTGTMQSGERNPHDVVVDIYNACIELGQPVEAARAPIQWINRQAGLAALPLPVMDDIEPEELNRSLLKTVEEFGDVVKVASAHLGDNIISPKEASDIDKEVHELIRQALVFNRMIQGAVKD